MTSRRRSLLIALLVFALSAVISECGKRRVSIPDELNDVVDDEEDEEWKQWGAKKSKTDDEPPPDFSKLTMPEIQAEIAKRQTGLALGFVKLRFGVSRTKDDVPLIAMKWSKVLRTGSVEVKFMAVDLNTIMFTMERGQDVGELKEFILSQPDAYEIKIGDQIYRRPGDPPLEEVIESLRRERSAESQGSTGASESYEDEL